MILITIYLLIMAEAVIECCGLCQMEEKFAWKKFDFHFVNETARDYALKSEEYIPERNIPRGVGIWREKLFISIPRKVTDGVPSTMNYVLLNTTEKSPKLTPFPNWESNIGNVVRFDIDVCDRLWLADTGRRFYSTNPNVSIPKILIYDLQTDELIKEYIIPKQLRQRKFDFNNIIVDVTKDHCENAFAYVADSIQNNLVIYSLKSNESWRHHNFFLFDSLYGGSNTERINFKIKAGVLGLALSPVQANGYRVLYFHSFSSTHEFAISTQILQNRTNVSDANAYKALGSRGPHMLSLGSSMDDQTEILFYTSVELNGVGCWNSKNHNCSIDNNVIVASNNVSMAWPSDLKVDRAGTLWVLSNRKYFSSFAENDFEEINFRIFKASVKDLVNGTVCVSPS